MTMSDILAHALRPDWQAAIGRPFTFFGRRGLLAAVTRQQGRLALWAFLHMPSPEQGGQWEPPATNRQRLEIALARPRHRDLDLGQITLQGVPLELGGWSASPVDIWQKYMLLQYFYGIGVDFSTLEDIPGEELVLYEYKIRDNPAFPPPGPWRNMPVEATVRQQGDMVPTAPALRLRLEVGEHGSEAPYSFADGAGQGQKHFYINGLECYDIVAETKARLSSPEYIAALGQQGMSDQEIAQSCREVLDGLDSDYPDGQQMLLLQYECPDNIQLDFYTARYLDSPYVPQSSGRGFIFRNTTEGSRHGMLCRTCVLGAVPRGFSGPVEVELLASEHRQPPITLCI